jgi:hypothetical protein
MPKSTSSPPPNGHPSGHPSGRHPRARTHRVRAHVARDAGVHVGARGRRPDEIWLTEASAGLHARPCGPARASPARQRDPDDQGRSRRTSHLPRAWAARRLPAVRFAQAAAWRPRHGPGDRNRGDRMARFAGDRSVGKAAAPGVYTMLPGPRPRSRPSDCGWPTAARITAWQ